MNPRFAVLALCAWTGCGSDESAASADAAGPALDGPSSSPDAAAPDASSPLPDVTQYVHPLIGTGPANVINPVGGGTGGSVFPGAVVPWGMVQFSPDTPRGEPSGYAYDDTSITGFSLTHFSGAGCPNNGDLPIMASRVGGGGFAYQHTNEHASPGYYDVTSNDGVRVELTATQRTGFARFTFPAGGGRISIDASRSQTMANTTNMVMLAGNDGLAGYTVGGGFCGGGTFPIYFTMQFDQPWTSQTLTGGKASFTFDGQTVQLRVGLSYFSQANSGTNLQTENPSWDFDAVCAQAKAEWNRRLNVVQVSGGSEDDKIKLYTALYHTLLHPNVYSDVTGDYIGFEHVNHHTDHVQYANFSGWDIYRSWAQLSALLFPDVTSDIVQSLINDAQQCGAFPKWSQNNVEDDVMAGDPGSLIVANAYAFGATGFDTQAALGIMRNMSYTQAACNGAVELPALNLYMGLGYTAGPNWSASDALEYAARDFAVSQFAKALGDDDLSRVLRARSAYWRNALHPSGLMEPRMADGSWISPLLGPADGFNGGYVEGNAEQYTWFVPHDPRGLFDALGGNAAVVPRLDRFFTQINAGGRDPYSYLGNEPGFNTPWLFNWAGAPSHTQDVVHRAIAEVFSTEPGGLPGNDDLGATSSWLVWALLGMYPELPGTGGVTLASPSFGDVIVHLAGDKSLHLRATGLPDHYVQSLQIDGQASSSLWLPIATLLGGPTLDFALGAAPSNWGIAPADAPPSFGAGEFAGLGPAADDYGVSTDGPNSANFDGFGWSYSAQALAQAAGSSGSFSFGGVTFPWTVQGGALDDIICQGQTITLAAQPGGRLGFLGAASAGPSAGTGTLHYTDGSTEPFTLTFSDWTLNAGSAMPAAGTQIAITTSYRNDGSGNHDNINTYIFFSSVALQAGKTLAAVTLPNFVSAGRLHVFAAAWAPTP
jgi:predicted alpha-1,2-mannosidase